MEWLNLKIAALRSPQYIGSTPIERATWINVLAWCAEQENGGIIQGGATWKDRQWQQTCGVTSREVRSADKLIAAAGEDLHVYGYPTDKQDQVQSRRLQAAEAARIRWEKKLGIAPRTASGDASRIPSRNAPRNAEGEEELELEGKRNAAHGAAPLPAPDSQPFETESEWIERLVHAWPTIDIHAQLRQAIREQNVSHNRELERGWFELHWLPKCTPTVSRARLIRGAAATEIPPDFAAWLTAEYPEAPAETLATYTTGRWQDIPATIREKFNARA
jgi:hypothetical protein